MTKSVKEKKVKAEKVKPLRKDADLGEKAAHAKDIEMKPNGEEHRPFPWTEPFPASVMSEGDNPKETVFVRATVMQDIAVNGKKYPVGQATLPSGFAHQYAACLGAPQ